MAQLPRYAIKYVSEVFQHLDFIESKYHRAIATAILQQLSFTPDSPTRNRKPLAVSAAFGATWELRFGPHNDFRVFYQVARTGRVVTVLAIGVKVGSRLFIGGEEFDL